MRLIMSDNTTRYYFHALSRLDISSLSPSMVERDGKKLHRYDRVLRENVSFQIRMSYSEILFDLNVSVFRL